MPILLSGCKGVELGNFSLSLPRVFSEEVQKVALLGGDVVVNAPIGYCIDESVTQAADGFAVMAPCAVLSETGAAPKASGLVTIQVGDTGTALVSELGPSMPDFLQSESGRAVLSHTGNVEQITVNKALYNSGHVEVFFDDVGAGVIEGLQSQIWRGFFDHGERLVTVSVRGFAYAPITEAEGYRILTATQKTAIDSVADGSS